MKNKLSKYVGEVTFNKGIECFASGNVKSINQINDNEYEVNVSDENIYHVHLKVNDISLCTCACPYHLNGNKTCKHIIASLISINPEEYEEEIESYKSTAPSLSIGSRGPRESSDIKPSKVETTKSANKSKEKNVFKLIGKSFLMAIVFALYFALWLVVGIFTFFMLLPPPWKMFIKSHQSEEDNNHNFDERLTDDEFHDLMEN